MAYKPTVFTDVNVRGELRVNDSDINGDVVAQVQGATIATTTSGTNPAFITAPVSGVLTAASFAGVDALAAHDTNYITFAITNLGQAGSGTAAMLAATDANTTKATGGSALVANSRRNLTLTATAADLAVVKGDRIRVTATVSGTLANTVTFPTTALTFKAS